MTEAGSSSECSQMELAPLLYKVSTICKREDEALESAVSHPPQWLRGWRKSHSALSLNQKSSEAPLDVLKRKHTLLPFASPKPEHLPVSLKAEFVWLKGLGFHIAT